MFFIDFSPVKTDKKSNLDYDILELQKYDTLAVTRHPILRKSVETKIHKGKNSKSYYKTKLLHSEYPSGIYLDKNISGKFDICIFSPNYAKKINKKEMKIDSNYVKPIFAFELGSEKIGDDKETIVHVSKDIDKLKNVKKSGFLIHIYRDITESPSHSKNRVKTDEKISRIKNVFEGLIDIPENIKIIAMILSPVRNEIKTYGKCQIYNKNSFQWEKVGKQKVTEFLYSQLK